MSMRAVVLGRLVQYHIFKQFAYLFARLLVNIENINFADAALSIDYITGLESIATFYNRILDVRVIKDLGHFNNITKNSILD